MYRIFFVLMVTAAFFAAPASANLLNMDIDDRFTISLNGNVSEIYDNATCVNVPMGSVMQIGVEQYPGGRWEIDIPNVYSSKEAGKEIMLLNIPNIQGIYQIIYHVPGIYYMMGASETMTLYLNIGDVGGDSYEKSAYAEYPQRHATITSDAYPDILHGGKMATFRFGNPDEAPYIKSLTVTTKNSVLTNDAKIILIPEFDANTIPKPAQDYWNLYDIKVNGFSPSEIENVDIVFGVPIGIPANYGFDPRYDIELLRFSEYFWETLDTALLYEGEGVRLGLDWYAAKSPGFSYYAVGFSENVTKLPEELYELPTPMTTIPTQTMSSIPTETVPTAPQQSSFGGLLALFGCIYLLIRRT